MRRTVLLVLLLLPFGLPACGGGGGGGGGGSALPGSLIALAIEGTPTPTGAPTVGSFAPFSVSAPRMDAASGGWAAFVATVNLSGGGSADVVYVAEPSGTLHEIFAVGEMAPSAGGTITGIGNVWMCGDGTVYVSITMTAPAPVLGIVSGRVSAGLVTSKQKVVYQNDILPGDAVNGVAAILESEALVDGTCTFWFTAILTNAAVGLYSIERDGTGAVRHVVTGGNVPPAAVVAGIDAFSVSEGGGYFGCVLDVGAGVQNVYSSAVGTGVIQLVATTTGSIPGIGGGTFVDAYKDGEPIFVSASGQVVFIGIGDQGATDEVLVIMEPAGTIDRVLARTGDAPNPALPDEYNTLNLLRQRLDTGSYPQFAATLTGGPLNIASYAYDIGLDVANRYVYDGRPYVGGGNFIGLLPGLTTGSGRRGNADISFAFRDQLDTGPTGIFWAFTTQPPLAIALEGGAALGGTDTFGSFSSTEHTTANGIVIFTAVLTGSGTGLFRQG